MIAIRDGLSDLAISHDEEDGNDQYDEDTEVGKLSDDDEPDLVVGTAFNMVQQPMERFWQTRIKIDELTQLGRVNVANIFGETDKMVQITELMVPAVIDVQTNPVVPVSASTN
jgi:hypothetical protein